MLKWSSMYGVTCRTLEEELVDAGLNSETIAELVTVLFRATALIRMWSLLTPTEARERLVTGSVRWEMVARDIFNRFRWRSCNRIGD